MSQKYIVLLLISISIKAASLDLFINSVLDSDFMRIKSKYKINDPKITRLIRFDSTKRSHQLIQKELQSIDCGKKIYNFEKKIREERTICDKELQKAFQTININRKENRNILYERINTKNCLSELEKAFSTWKIIETMTCFKRFDPRPTCYNLAQLDKCYLTLKYLLSL